MRILVVEDGAKVGNLLVSILEKWAQQVVLARDGEQAWQILHQQAVDFLIVDWEMPVLSGIGLVRRLRQTSQYARLPVLMASGKSDQEQIATALRSGVDDYLTKPFSPRSLREKIKEVLKKSGEPSAQQLVDQVLAGHEVFDREGEAPLVIFGEKTRDPEALAKLHNRSALDYLSVAVEAIAAANRDNEGLDVGYLIETSSQGIVARIKKREASGRAMLVAVSNECGGNSVLLVRLLNINRAPGLTAVLVCEQVEQIPLQARYGLEGLDVEIIERKKLDPAKLRALVDRSVVEPWARSQGGGAPLAPEEIRQRILDDLQALATLPVLPEVCQRVAALAQDPGSEMAEWGAAVGADPSCRAMIYGRARCPGYGFEGSIEDIDEAVSLLGKNEVENLVVSDALHRAFGEIEGADFSPADLWRHSAATGCAAQILAFPPDRTGWTAGQRRQFESFQLGAAAVDLLGEIDVPGKLRLAAGATRPFVAGMMHDIGKAVMAQSYPGLYGLMVAEMEKGGWSAPMAAAEMAVAGGLTHDLVGEIVAEQWGLDPVLRGAIRHHHQPEGDDTFPLLIALADLVAHVAAPFPREAKFPIGPAVAAGDLRWIAAFLPRDFLSAPPFDLRRFCSLVTEIAPAVARLAADMQRLADERD